jgi:cyclase
VQVGRRQILEGALGGVAGLSLGAVAWRAPVARAQPRVGAADTQQLAEDLYLLTVDDTHLVAATEPGGVVLVDGGAAVSSRVVLDALEQIASGSSVHTLFNTHWHPEQTGLNERLGAGGTTIIAQENTRLWLTTDITYPWDGRHFEPLTAAGQPNRTFYDDGALESGVRYGYLRHAAHTDGDLYVQFPDANVLVVGDTVTGPGAGWPFVDWWTGGWIGGLVGNLELLLSLADEQTRIVPARGGMLRRSDLQAQLEMYNVIYERLARLLNGGMGTDEAIAARPTAEFDAEMGPPEDFVHQAFQSLWAYLSPDA